jgi:predicted DNA-binding protein with PD1-like motif
MKQNKIHAFRLHPGDDLRSSLSDHCTKNNIEAAVLLSCVGSLTEAILRFAGRENGTRITGPLEIVSATGTLSRHGLHLHIAVADANGDVAGGHLAAGCLIRTTCEIVLQEIDSVIFKREADPQTGYNELTVQPAN